MRDLTDEIEEAQAKVAHLRIRAERPSARLEDEFALEKARNRLLTLELRNLKQGSEARGSSGQKSRMPGASRAGREGQATFKLRTKNEQMPRTARERAEAAFAAVQGNAVVKKGRV
ncbi:hypothetical protein FMN63_20270 [Stappia sp. BW2]|uniref:hypothetical protein n=1 Tax=Stappia sp. BW2 TaxID=2592622 RepID=UPI0011DEF5F6|nr:hypothetical protein [Stappia sp. BW2]TYC64796.1 hypothetical protein FMN63_20270 [Stappia sp. BW2]